MTEMDATIRNEHGIHCRPSTAIVKSVDGYGGKILVTGQRGSTKLKSVLELMSLELFPGAQVTIRVSGPDEEKVCRDLVTLFETHFDFPPREG